MAARRGNEQEAQAGDSDAAKLADDEGKAEHQYTCGIVRPIAAFDGYTSLHWEEVEKIIVEALEPVGFKVALVSADDAISVIHGRIVRNLAQNDLVIVDVSGKNPNVMLELGLRLAFDKPVMVIKDNITEYSFDTSPIEHMTYPADLHYFTMTKFASDIARKALATVKAPETEGYQSFLQHFPIQKPAKGLESKELSPMDFLFVQMNELQRSMDHLLSSQKEPSYIPMGEKINFRNFSLDDVQPDLLDDVQEFVMNFKAVREVEVLKSARNRQVLRVVFGNMVTSSGIEEISKEIRTHISSLRYNMPRNRSVE